MVLVVEREADVSIRLMRGSKILMKHYLGGRVVDMSGLI